MSAGQRDPRAEAARLEADNAALRDLLAAISEAAGAVPVARVADELAEWKRSTRVLASIKAAAKTDSQWRGHAAYWTAELRRVAAEHPGYEPYQPGEAGTQTEGASE